MGTLLQEHSFMQSKVDGEPDESEPGASGGERTWWAAAGFSAGKAMLCRCVWGVDSEVVLLQGHYRYAAISFLCHNWHALSSMDVV